MEGGAGRLKPVLSTLAEKAVPIAPEGEAKRKPPIIVIAIDQGEEGLGVRRPNLRVAF